MQLISWPMVKKGQWHDYEDGKKKEYGEFVRKAGEFVYGREQPWTPNPNDMGQPAKNDPRALVICLLLKIWLCKPYRDTVSFLSESAYLWPIIGLEALPGRMDLQRAMNRLTREYLDSLNSFIVEQGYYGKKTGREGYAPSIALASRSGGT
jgi:hypothetical protein